MPSGPDAIGNSMNPPVPLRPFDQSRPFGKIGAVCMAHLHERAPPFIDGFSEQLLDIGRGPGHRQRLLVNAGIAELSSKKEEDNEEHSDGKSNSAGGDDQKRRKDTRSPAGVLHKHAARWTSLHAWAQFRAARNAFHATPISRLL